MKNTGLFFLFILSALFLKGQQLPTTMPEFNFSKLAGTPFTNKQLATGKKLFFVFFDPECDHCRHAIASLNEHEMELNGTAVYLISVATKLQINSFLDHYGPLLKNNKHVILLQDLKNDFILKFKPKKYPALFLYAADKKLLLHEDDESSVPAFLEKIKQ